MNAANLFGDLERRSTMKRVYFAVLIDDFGSINSIETSSEALESLPIWWQKEEKC